MAHRDNTVQHSSYRAPRIPSIPDPSHGTTGERNRCFEACAGGRTGNETLTAPNPPWLGKGKVARQTANCHRRLWLVGVTPGRVTPCQVWIPIN